MRLKEILDTKGSQVWSVKSSQNVGDALKVLVENRIGALLVFDKTQRIVGILSERDIMRECYKNRKEWDQALVSEVMTKKVIISAVDDRVDYIMGIMTQNRIRHIPVMEGEKLIGIISIGDVVKAQLSDSQYENHYLKEYLSGS